MNRHRRHDAVTIPAIYIAVVLSILVHVAALWLAVPQLRSLGQQTRATDTLAVQIAPRKSVLASAAAPALPPVQATPAPPRAEPARPERVAPRRPAPRATPAPRKAPPVMAQPRSPTPAPPRVAEPSNVPTPPPVPERSDSAAERTPSPATAPAPEAQRMPPPPAQDLAAYVDARRRARGEAPAPSAPDAADDASDIARRDRIVAANLGLNRTPTFGNDPRNAGGLFQITELGYDDARFYFFGFDRDIGRNARQLIEVRKAGNADIRIAIVRRMIGIIREKIPGDFVWVSQRLGRRVTLSARPEDNAGLEDFILHDLFPDARLP